MACHIRARGAQHHQWVPLEHNCPKLEATAGHGWHRAIATSSGKLRQQSERRMIILQQTRDHVTILACRPVPTSLSPPMGKGQWWWWGGEGAIAYLKALHRGWRVLAVHNRQNGCMNHNKWGQLIGLTFLRLGLLSDSKCPLLQKPTGGVHNQNTTQCASNHYLLPASLAAKSPECRARCAKTYGECLPGEGPVCTQEATFIPSIPISAPPVPQPREAPQADNNCSL